MRRYFVVLATLALGASIAAPGVGAQAQGRFERLDARGATTFVPALTDAHKQIDVIVKLVAKPLAQHVADARAEGRTLSKAQRAAVVRGLKDAQAGVIRHAKALGATVRYSYQTTYNGFSVRIAAGQLSKLESLSGVDSVHATRIVMADNVRGVPFIGAPAAWADLGLTGTGMKIGVIDTGIDYYHANFAGSGNPADFAADNGLTIGTAAFPNSKVAGGYDFVGDDYDAAGSGAALTPHPDPDPLDCNGHGSHVAGTAAGFGVLSNGSTYTGLYNAATVSGNSWTIGPGVAPEATIYSYRVFGCDGSASDDVIIAAIEQAAADGVDVINMSLGAPFGRDDNSDSEAVDNATLLGVLTVASAGNSGPSAYIVGSPGTANTALNVAAVDGSFATFPTGVIDIGAGITLANNNSGPLPVGPATVAVLPDGNGGISLGCSASEYAGTAGKIVVTKRGTCARVARAEFGQAAGAVAVIMVNNNAGFPPYDGPIPGVTIPFLGALVSDAAALIAANGISHTISVGPSIPNPGYKALASFTSGGPRNGDSAAKPDVTAPGVSVLSTAVGTGTEGEFISGTSMASPHAAGSAILVRQAHPTWSPEAIKAVIENTASADSSVLTSTSTDVRLAGAGVVQPRKAAASAVYATTDTDGGASLSFGYEPLSGAYTETHTITFHNTSGTARTFNLARVSQRTLGSTFGFSSSSVLVPAGGTASVDFTINLSAAAVAALPQADTFVAGPGGLATVRGLVTATPAVAASDVTNFRIPYMLVPRGLSNITAGSPSAYSVSNGVATRTATLTNSGIRGSEADIYAWGIADGADPSLGAIDIRNVGVQTLPGSIVNGVSKDDRVLVFAVNVGGRWSNAATNEYDIAIDTDSNGKLDYIVVGVDNGAVTTGLFDGVMASFVFKANNKGGFTIIDEFVADAPMNGSTLLLPALASDLGLKRGASKFSYSVAGFQIFDAPGTFVDVTSTAGFDAYKPPISTGDYIHLNPGANAPLSMAVDLGRYSIVKPLGWLLVTLDDANGAAQADGIPIGSVPTH